MNTYHKIALLLFYQLILKEIRAYTDCYFRLRSFRFLVIWLFSIFVLCRCWSSPLVSPCFFFFGFATGKIVPNYLLRHTPRSFIRLLCSVVAYRRPEGDTIDVVSLFHRSDMLHILPGFIPVWPWFPSGDNGINPTRFSEVIGKLPVFMATRTGNLPVPVRRNGVS